MPTPPLPETKESTSKSNSSPNCPPYRPPLPFSATYRNMLRSPTSVSLKIKFAANGTSRVFRSIFSCVKNKDSKKILIFTHSKQLTYADTRRHEDGGLGALKF